MDNNNWISVKEKKAPEGIVVETKIDRDGNVCNEQELVFDNPLWFFPDKSMYVYYEPTHWRPTPLTPQ